MLWLRVADPLASLGYFGWRRIILGNLSKAYFPKGYYLFLVDQKPRSFLPLLTTYLLWGRKCHPLAAPGGIHVYHAGNPETIQQIVAEKAEMCLGCRNRWSLLGPSVSYWDSNYWIAEKGAREDAPTHCCLSISAESYIRVHLGMESSYVSKLKFPLIVEKTLRNFLSAQHTIGNCTN